MTGDKKAVARSVGLALAEKIQGKGISAAVFENDYYVMVQFSEIPSGSMKENLRRSGIELNSFLPGNAYLAVVKNSFDFTKARLFGISAVNVIPPAYKIDSRLLNYKNSTDREQAHVFAVPVPCLMSFYNLTAGC